MKVFLFHRRHLITIAIIVAGTISLAVVVSFTQTLVTVFKPSEKLLPIYRVYTPEKRLSISFDAAWGSDKTPKILEILRKYNVKTTFFLVGFWIENNPDMAKRIVEEGHEIGNHSSTHPKMGGLSEEKIYEELKRTHDIIKETTGFETTLFRPPFGDYSNTLIRAAEKFGYKVIQWDVDSLDWKNFSSRAIADRVLSRVENGSIVLFHNNGAHTPEAVDIILEKLISEGYEIIPISRLLIDGEYYIDHRGEQRPVGK